MIQGPPTESEQGASHDSTSWFCMVTKKARSRAFGKKLLVARKLRSLVNDKNRNSRTDTTTGVTSK